MTQEQKNIAIAEMLGLVALQAPYKGAVSINGGNYKGQVFFDSLEGESWYEYPKYDQDANWQFEAIDWIEKQKVYIRIEKPIGKLSSWFVNFDSEHSEIKEVQIFNKNRKEAIFEALYQFSQYIKDKKPTVGDPATYAYEQVKAEIDNFGKSKK